MAGEISFQPTKADLLAAYRAYFRRSVFTRKFVGIVAAGVGCVALIGGGMTWDDPSLRVRLSVTGLMCIGFALFMVTMAAINYALLPRGARRLFDQHRILRRDYRFAWDDIGTKFSAAHAHSDLAWHDYHGWYDGRGVVLLLLNERLFQFIPHRVLTAEQLADLRALAPRAGEAAPASDVP